MSPHFKVRVSQGALSQTMILNYLKVRCVHLFKKLGHLPAHFETRMWSGGLLQKLVAQDGSLLGAKPEFYVDSDISQ